MRSSKKGIVIAFLVMMVFGIFAINPIIAKADGTVSKSVTIKLSLKEGMSIPQNYGVEYGITYVSSGNFVEGKHEFLIGNSNYEEIVSSHTFEFESGSQQFTIKVTSAGNDIYIGGVKNNAFEEGLNFDATDILNEYEFELRPGNGGGGNSPSSISWNTMNNEINGLVDHVEISVNDGAFTTFDNSAMELHENDKIKVKVIFVNDGNYYEVFQPSLVYLHKTNENVRFDYKYSDNSTQAPENMGIALSNNDGYTFTFKPEADSKDASGQIGLAASDAWMRLQFNVKQNFNDKADVFVYTQILGDDNVSYGVYREEERGVFNFEDNLDISEIGFLINNNEYGGQGDPIGMGYGFRNDGSGVNGRGEKINSGNLITAKYEAKFKGHTGIQNVNPVAYGYFEVGVTNPGGTQKNTFKLKEEFARDNLIDSILVAVGDTGDFEHATEIPRGENGDFSFELDASNRYSFLIRRHDSGARNVGWHYVANGEDDDCYVDFGKVYIQKIVRGDTVILDGLQTDKDGEALLDQYGTPKYDTDLIGTDAYEGDWSITSSGGNFNLKKGDKVTIKLIPVYGYQIASASLNGAELTPNEEVSSFTFTMNGTYHLGGSFVKYEDVTNNESKAVSAVEISNGENATDSGNLSLTVTDNAKYAKKEEAVKIATENGAAAAETIATLDLSLVNFVSKGDGTFWNTGITEFKDDINISLKLDDIKLEEGEKIAIIRDHNGELTLLEAAFDDKTDELSFPTNRFSTYSIIKISSGEAETDAEDFVKRAYEKCLGRDGDKGGIEYWTNELENGTLNATSMLEKIVFSEEYLEKQTSNTEYVKMLYTTFMGREYDKEGLRYWVHMLLEGTTREEVFKYFLESEEFDGVCKEMGIEKGEYELKGYEDPVRTDTQVTEEIKGFVERLYGTVMGRTSDEEGLKFWGSEIANDISDPVSVAVYFFSSSEFNDKNLNDEDFVEVLYTALMGRASDEEGKKFWVNELANGCERNVLIEEFAGCPEFCNIVDSFGL